jgi:hypothetical protein
MVMNDRVISTVSFLQFSAMSQPPHRCCTRVLRAIVYYFDLIAPVNSVKSYVV